MLGAMISCSELAVALRLATSKLDNPLIGSSTKLPLPEVPAKLTRL